MFGACFASAAATTVLGLFAWVGAGDQQPKLALDVYALLEERVRALSRGGARDAHVRQVAFLGDSMLFEKELGTGVPARLERTVNSAGADWRVEVRPVVIPGSNAFDYYFVLDELMEAQPDEVLISFNLTTLSDTWRFAFARPELSGLLAPRRIPEALRLPLYWTGLTADRLLSYVAWVRLGWVDEWIALTRRQLRISNLRLRAEKWAEQALGAPAEGRFRGLRFLRETSRRAARDANRFLAPREVERFGPALSGVSVDHPVLRALGAAVEDLVRRGVPVLVYVNPANVEHLERLELLDREGLARTVRSVESVVAHAGGRVADFHALLPDEAFADPSGHFTHAGRKNGSRTLAEAIAAARARQAPTNAR